MPQTKTNVSPAKQVPHYNFLKSKVEQLSGQERAWLKQSLDQQRTNLPEFWQSLLICHNDDKQKAWHDIELPLAQDEKQVLYLRFTIVGSKLSAEKALPNDQ